MRLVFEGEDGVGLWVNGVGMRMGMVKWKGIRVNTF